MIVANTVEFKYTQKMLKDPEVRFYYEQERLKTQIAMVVKTARLNAHLTQAALAKKSAVPKAPLLVWKVVKTNALPHFLCWRKSRLLVMGI